MWTVKPQSCDPKAATRKQEEDKKPSSEVLEV